jgi:periplasmic copper chaperone A
MRRLSVLLLATLPAALPLASCGKPQAITIDHAWVRLAAVPKNPAAAYFTIHGGSKDETLVSVDTAVSIRSEMHESMDTGGMSTMKPIASVPIPAGGTVTFAPGGKHVMFFDMNPGITPGTRVPMLFTFADGERIEISGRGIGAGDPAPTDE